VLQSASKLAFAVFVVATGFSSAVFAQALTSAQRTACKADYEKYCKDTTPGGGRIIACLDKQQLSEGCQGHRRHEEIERAVNWR
jgi:Cysteine rich repeat